MALSAFTLYVLFAGSLFCTGYSQSSGYNSQTDVTFSGTANAEATMDANAAYAALSPRIKCKFRQFCNGRPGPRPGRNIKQKIKTVKRVQANGYEERKLEDSPRQPQKVIFPLFTRPGRTLQNNGGAKIRVDRSRRSKLSKYHRRGFGWLYQNYYGPRPGLH